jgi:hypothetical protein
LDFPDFREQDMGVWDNNRRLWNRFLSGHFVSLLSGFGKPNGNCLFPARHFFLLRPLFKVRSFSSCRARSTFSPAAFEYFGIFGYFIIDPRLSHNGFI